MSNYIGIDPGVSGAIIALNDRGLLVWTAPLPVAGPPKHRILDARKLHDLIEPDSIVCFEELVPMPGRGAIGAVSMGKLHGSVMAVLQLRNCRVTEVRSQTWQKIVGGLPSRPPTPKGMDPKEKARIVAAHRKNVKAVLTQKAVMACPELGFAIDAAPTKAETDGYADAYWMARYCMGLMAPATTA